MANLTQDDLQQIRIIFDKSFTRIWEDNIEPVMATKDELKGLETNIKREIRKDIQDARDYIDRRNGETSGVAISRDHRLDDKITLTGRKLNEKQIFSNGDVKQIEEINVFATPRT